MEAMDSAAPTGGGRVVVEAQFAVGEYEIVILSANDSGALDRWLRQHGYQIPAGADAVLRPYVQQGMKFFVAKVDVARVTFQQGRAVLSPLQVSYDSESFSLPVRLGLLNSGGEQDLLVHILAPNQRYEVANYRNVTVPTNINVQDRTRDEFGRFYEAVFRETLAANRGAVVTEYAWQASSCDPCPGGMGGLNPTDLQTLGASALGGAPSAAGRRMPNGGLMPPGRRGIPPFVLTRLHYRYSPAGLGEDLVFRAAPPIEGGRENTEGHGARPASVNNFQARYAIRHAFAGPITCQNPQRGVWGPPPAGVDGNRRAVTPPGLEGGGRVADQPASQPYRGSGTTWTSAATGALLPSAPSAPPATPATPATPGTGLTTTVPNVPTPRAAPPPPAAGPVGCSASPLGLRSDNGLPQVALFALALLGLGAARHRRV
jgi:hypothetical protein